MEKRLFVYGTLRQGHLMHGLLRPLGRFLGRASVKGRLYDLGGYPGLVLDDAAGWVHGELYSLTRPGQAFEVLDEYEGCLPAEVGKPEYRRVLCEVVNDRGRFSKAWMYEYVGSVAGFALLADGNYPPPKTRRRLIQALSRR